MFWKHYVIIFGQLCQLLLAKSPSLCVTLANCMPRSITTWLSLPNILGQNPNSSITLINSVSEALSITIWSALPTIIGQKPKPLDYIEKLCVAQRTTIRLSLPNILGQNPYPSITLTNCMPRRITT